MAGSPIFFIAQAFSSLMRSWPHVACDLRSNAFGLTCAKFEGAGGNTWQIDWAAPSLRQSRSW